LSLGTALRSPTPTRHQGGNRTTTIRPPAEIARNTPGGPSPVDELTLREPAVQALVDYPPIGTAAGLHSMEAAGIEPAFSRVCD
jgi:hypothetical protein